jgi:hypothetical protein
MVIRCLPVVSAAARHNLPRYVQSGSKAETDAARCRLESELCLVQDWVKAMG